MVKMFMAVTEFTKQADKILRSPVHFNWEILCIFGLIIYVYATEIEHKRYDTVLAGVALWLADWFNELINTAVLHVTHHAALWTVTGDTSYLILIGISIEISLYFLIDGIIFVKLLPKSTSMKIAGIPNRIVYVVGASILSTGAELILRQNGILHWGYWWWNVPMVIILGYCPLYGIAAWVHDNGSNRSKQLMILGSIAGIDAILAVIFGFAGWL